MESLPWIEPNSLANARKWQEHDVAAESTTGPFGGQSDATFAVKSCLSFRSQKWRAGCQQRADSRLQHQRPPQKAVLPVSSLYLNNATLFS